MQSEPEVKHEISNHYCIAVHHWRNCLDCIFNAGNDMNITEEQFIELIALLSQIETSGRINFVPVLGLAGAEEAFFTIQEFISKLEKQA